MIGSNGALTSLSGLEGMTRRIMPAYFASQRQIIINAEALIARRRTLTGDPFVDASNVIGSRAIGPVPFHWPAGRR